MKLVIAVAFSLMATAAFANEVKDAISSIEANTNTKCKYVDASRSICGGLFGTAYAKCTYTETYLCTNDSEALNVKIRILDSFNFRTNKREKEVTSVSLVD